MKEKVGIFVHPYSASPVKEKVQVVTERFPGSFPTQEVSELRQGSGPILIIGGDGSVRRVMQFLAEEEDLRPLGILGGGTNNILHRALVKDGLSLSLEEFIAASPEDFDTRYSFHPGILGERIFNITVGFGEFEKTAGILSEKLRAYTPRRLKTPISAVFGLISNLAKNDPDALPFNLFSTSPDFGSVTLFPGQELHSSLLTHAWIEEKGFEGRKKLALTLLCWQTGIEPPPSILKTEQALEFELIDGSSKIWVDGDTLPTWSHGNVLISRASKAFSVTAIV